MCDYSTLSVSGPIVPLEIYLRALYGKQDADGDYHDVTGLGWNLARSGIYRRHRIWFGSSGYSSFMLR